MFTPDNQEISEQDSIFAFLIIEVMQFLSIINFTAAMQGLFLAYLLVNRRVNVREYRMLALLLLVMSLALLGECNGQGLRLWPEV